MMFSSNWIDQRWNADNLQRSRYMPTWPHAEVIHPTEVETEFQKGRLTKKAGEIVFPSNRLFSSLIVPRSSSNKDNPSLHASAKTSLIVNSDTDVDKLSRSRNSELFLMLLGWNVQRFEDHSINFANPSDTRLRLSFWWFSDGIPIGTRWDSY